MSVNDIILHQICVQFGAFIAESQTGYVHLHQRLCPICRATDFGSDGLRSFQVGSLPLCLSVCLSETKKKQLFFLIL